MARYSLRDYIDLVEARSTGPWPVVFGEMFAPTLGDFKRTYPDIAERVKRFISVKETDPLSIRYGKYDRPMTGPMIGFQHCHLAPDLILLYTLAGRAINMVGVCSHADIEGKRTKATAKRFAPYRA